MTKLSLELAQRNYDALSDLLKRFTSDDRKDTRETIRLRVEEAKKILDDTKRHMMNGFDQCDMYPMDRTYP